MSTAGKHETSIFHSEVFRMLDLKKVLTIPSVTNQPDVLETFGGMQVKPSQLENDFEL
jgi:hypothetical protein